MSVRPSTARRGLTAALTCASAAVLIGLAAPAAVADPPALNTDPCATSLARAGVWPGVMTDGERTVRLVSDGFDSYLSRQQTCHSAH
jgi:hypothetical protein